MIKTVVHLLITRSDAKQKRSSRERAKNLRRKNCFFDVVSRSLVLISGHFHVEEDLKAHLNSRGENRDLKDRVENVTASVLCHLSGNVVF